MNIVGKLRKIGDVPVLLQKEVIHVKDNNTKPFNLSDFAKALLEDKDWKKELFKSLTSNIVFGGEGAVQKFPVVHQHTVTVDDTYTITDVREGINIYGIQHTGAVTVYLPKAMRLDSILYVKDLSNNAGTYPITIQ